MQSWQSERPSAIEKADPVQSGKEASLVQREVAANAAGGIDPVPGRPSAIEKADPVQSGKEASLVQREVAANAAGGIDPVPGRPSAIEKAGCVRLGKERYGSPDTGTARRLISRI